MRGTARKYIVHTLLYLSPCVHNLNDNSRLWEMEAFYTGTSPVLIYQRVPVREKSTVALISITTIQPTICTCILISFIRV